MSHDFIKCVCHCVVCVMLYKYKIIVQIYLIKWSVDQFEICAYAYNWIKNDAC